MFCVRSLPFDAQNDRPHLMPHLRSKWKHKMIKKATLWADICEGPIQFSFPFSISTICALYVMDQMSPFFNNELFISFIGRLTQIPSETMIFVRKVDTTWEKNTEMWESSFLANPYLLMNNSVSLQIKSRLLKTLFHFHTRK